MPKKPTILFDHRGQPVMMSRVAGKMVAERPTGTALAEVQRRYPRLHVRASDVDERPSLGRVKHGHSSSGQFGNPYILSKTAQAGVGGGASDAGATSVPGFSGRTTLTSPEVRNPLLNIVNFYLPTNYKVLNQWLRYYDRFHPIVGNLIDLNGSFPISDFDLVGVEDKRALGVFETMKDVSKLVQVLLDMNREIELLGECYPYAHWDDDQGIFDQIALMNPDNCVVRDNPLAYGDNLQIEYEPDESLFALIHSQDPRDREIVANLDPSIVYAVVNGTTIPIDPFNIRQVARKASPYDPRGTPILLRALKDLLYEDKLRETQYAVADSKIYPKEIWMLGDPDNGWIPSEEELNDFRKLLSDAAHDPVFSIVTHRGLEAKFEGAAGRLLPIVPEFEFVKDRVLIALHGSATMFGEGGPYATANVVFAIIQGRYQARRQKLWEWVKYLYTQVALYHGFYKRTRAELDHKIIVKNRAVELDVPDMCEWKSRLQLVDDPQRTMYYRQMRDKLELSYRSWCEHIGVDADREKARLKDEEGEITDPLYQQNRQLANQAAQEAVLMEMVPGMTPDEAQKVSEEVSDPTWELQTGVEDGGTGGGGGSTTKPHKPPEAGAIKVPGMKPGGQTRASALEKFRVALREAAEKGRASPNPQPPAR